MSKDMTKVTHLPTTLEFEGVKYGPFVPSEGKAYIEVPTVIATALHLPEYDGQPTPVIGSVVPDAEEDKDNKAETEAKPAPRPSRSKA